MGQHAEQNGAQQAADVEPDQHAASQRSRIAHVDDQLGDPLDDEVERHDVGEERGRQQDCRLRKPGLEESRHARWFCRTLVLGQGFD